MKYWTDINFSYNDMQSAAVESAKDCMNLCLSIDKCMAISFDTLRRFSSNCMLKTGVSKIVLEANGWVSAIKCNYVVPAHLTLEPAEGRHSAKGMLS